MSLLDWLTGGTSKNPELPRPQELVAGGSRISALYAGGRVQVWSAETGKLERELETSSPGLAMNADGTLLALADGRIVFLELDKMGVHAPHRGQPFFLFDGRLLLLGYEQISLGPPGDPTLILEIPGFNPSANVRVVSGPEVVLLDPSFKNPIVIRPDGLQTFKYRPAQVMGGCWDGPHLLSIQESMIRRWTADGELIDENRPHPLQTLNVGPGGVSVGLDVDDSLWLRVGEQSVALPSPAPNRPELSVREDGVLVELHRGYAWLPTGATTPTIVQLEGGRRRPINARGGRRRLGLDKVALGTSPLTLYSLVSGRCSQVFER